VLQQKYPLKKQEEIFLKLILNNKKVASILERGFVDEIADWYLVAGCLNQTIWNQLTNRQFESEIEDYDLIYFDPDTSAEKEKSVQKKVNKKYEDLKIHLDIVNQARVHLWTEKDWGLKIRPLASCEDAIASWPITVSCIGIRKEDDDFIIVAPYGLTDNLEMVLRPNKLSTTGKRGFDNKTSKWVKKWPELTLIPW